MKYRTTSILICITVSIFLGASACLRGVRPAPDLTYLDINPGSPPPAGAVSEDILLLRRIGVQSPFGDRRIIYRTGSGTYKPDYYVRFVSSPSDILTDRLETWLDDSRLFGAVVKTGTSVEYRYILEGEVNELCGDYSNPQQPRAVIAANFKLVDDAGGKGQIILSKRYRYAEPVASSDPIGMAASWGTALRNIFLELNADLRDRFSEIK